MWQINPLCKAFEKAERSTLDALKKVEAPLEIWMHLRPEIYEIDCEELNKDAEKAIADAIDLMHVTRHQVNKIKLLNEEDYRKLGFEIGELYATVTLLAMSNKLMIINRISYAQYKSILFL